MISFEILLWTIEMYINVSMKNIIQLHDVCLFFNAF